MGILKKSWFYKLVISIIAAVFLIAAAILVINHFQNKITVSLVGDILLDRGVGRKMESDGMDYPFEKVSGLLRRSDIVLGNLECPITEKGFPTKENPNITFRAKYFCASALKEANFNVLNLANNHIFDYGKEGLEDTLEALNKEMVLNCGAGKDVRDATKPVFISIRGIKVGFMGISGIEPGGDYNDYISMLDENKLPGMVSSAKSQCDFLSVSFHWGNEYETRADSKQKEIAHIAIDSGADVVVGHHPHVLQEFESYRGKPIFYSLGNFIFDRQAEEGTDKSQIITLIISKNKIEKIVTVPVMIDNCQPYVISK